MSVVEFEQPVITRSVADPKEKDWRISLGHIDVPLLGHTGGRERYFPLRENLAHLFSETSLAFGRRYNEGGLTDFYGLVDEIVAKKRGQESEVTFDINLPGLGFNYLFGNEQKGEGIFLGPIGEERLGDWEKDHEKKVRIISLVLADTRLGKRVVPVSSEVYQDTILRVEGGITLPMRLHKDNELAHVRTLRGDLKITNLFPPLDGGKALPDSRAKAFR